MPNVNILKLNDILREKDDNVPKRGKVKSIQISDKIVEGLKNKNISPSTIEKLSRMQGTIVSDRREVHHKIDGYDFYVTDYRGKRGHYETVKVSYRTEKLLLQQNKQKEEKTVKKAITISDVKTTTIKKTPVLKLSKSKIETVDFKKTIINKKSAKTVSKVSRDKLLNEDLKVIDFNNLEQENKNKVAKNLTQVKPTTLQRKLKKPNSSSKIIKPAITVVESSDSKPTLAKPVVVKTTTTSKPSVAKPVVVKTTTASKPSKTLKVSKNTNPSNLSKNNIATKRNIIKSSSNSKKPNTIENNKNTEQWYTSSQIANKSNFWDKIVHATKTVASWFNITRLVKRGW